MDQQKRNEKEETKAIATDGLRLLASINRLSSSVLLTQHTDLSSRELFLLGYQLRLLRLSQAIELLVSKELIDPAAAILRVMLEMGFVMSAIDDDPSRFANLLREQGVEGGKALRGLRQHLKPDERHAELTDERLDNEIASAPTGSGFVVQNWAGLAKHGASYATLYRRLSAFAHGGAGGTMEYLEKDANGDPVLKSNVAMSLAPDLLIVAGALMVDGLQIFPRKTMVTSRAEELKVLEEELKTLSDRAYTLM